MKVYTYKFLKAFNLFQYNDTGMVPNHVYAADLQIPQNKSLGNLNDILARSPSNESEGIHDLEGGSSFHSAPIQERIHHPSVKAYDSPQNRTSKHHNSLFPFFNKKANKIV